MAKTLVSIAVVLTILSTDLFAADPPSKPRTGTTQTFGNGTLTKRSDGSSSQTQKFGNGTRTTESDKSGHTVTGTTQKFGNGTLTKRSDGSSSQTQKFGNGTITNEKPGRSSSKK